MPLAPHKSICLVRVDANQGHGKGEDVQRLASRHSGFMTGWGELARSEQATGVRGCADPFQSG